MVKKSLTQLSGEPNDGLPPVEECPGGALGKLEGPGRARGRDNTIITTDANEVVAKLTPGRLL
jgi:hypothetical protein